MFRQRNFIKNFKEKLTEMYQFPTEYLFKFIIPNDQEKQAEIFRVFDGLKHTITERDSKKRKIYCRECEYSSG